MKPIFLIGAGKGRLMPILNEYLNSLGIKNNQNSRKLVYDIETDKYILRIALLRWEDIRKNYNKFDMITYGTDQWLEDGHKAMIGLKYFSQGNCRISLLVPENRILEYSNNSIFEYTIATSYPRLAREYLGISPDKIFEMSGSVETAIGLGWADCAFDVLDSGKTALENGLVEVKTCIKFGATLATCRPEKIPLMVNYGLIDKPKNALLVAFDGNDGTGKSTLAKHLVQNGVWTNKPAVLVSPYSGDVGKEADSLRKKGLIYEWATVVGRNHWRAPGTITSIYDRSILTFLTEMIDSGMPDEKIKIAIDTWKPFPGILFFCNAPPEISYSRIGNREEEDEFGEMEILKKYYHLYIRAFEYLKILTGIQLIELNTSMSIENTLNEIKGHLKLPI